MFTFVFSGNVSSKHTVFFMMNCFCFRSHKKIHGQVHIAIFCKTTYLSTTSRTLIPRQPNLRHDCSSRLTRHSCFSVLELIAFPERSSHSTVQLELRLHSASLLPMNWYFVGNLATALSRDNAWAGREEIPAGQN